MLWQKSTLEKMKWIQELLADTGVTQIFQSTCPDVTKPVSQMREWILAWIRKQTECETTAGAEFSAEIAKLIMCFVLFPNINFIC